MVVDVLPGMTLAQVIVRLREAHGDQVTIRISPESSLLLTANEFRALSLAAEREQVAIAVETRDGLRRQLAALFGVPISIPDDDEDSPEPEHAPEEQSEGDQGAPDNGTPTTLPPIQPGNGNGKLTESRNRWSGSRLLALVAGIALLGALGVAGYWFFLRTAEIHLKTVREPVNATIAFSVVRPEADPATAAGAIPGEPVSFELSVTLDAPATGIESVGQTSASGSLELRNPGNEPVTILAGTTIETWEGDTFVTSEEVTVPAAENGSAGEGVVAIAAETPGASANRDVGMLSGQLENGVYFSNRGTPVAGGADVTTTVVTQQDIDALQARAEETLRSLAATSSLSGDRRVVPSTLEIQQFTTQYSSEVGEEAETITVDASITFDALAFPTEELDAGAEQILVDQVPAGYALVPGTIAYEVPVETGEANGAISMIVPIAAEASAVVTDEEREEIGASVAGESASEATSHLERDPRFTGVQIDVSPGWLPQQLPSSSDDIEVIVE